MATILETFNHLLFLLPSETHQKVKQIYSRVPGTLMDFLKVNTVQKKVGCRNKITIDGKLHLPNENRNSSDLTPDITDPHKVAAHDEKNIIPVDPPKRQISCEPQLMSMEYDHDNWDRFRVPFFDSLKHEFHDNSITEISANDIGNMIFSSYQKQCLNLDKHSKTSSLPIRFEKRYSVNDDSGQMNVGVCYVDAYIVCQTTKNWRHLHQTEMTYDVTIEFNGLSQDYDRTNRFIEMVVKNDVPTVIEMIEEKSKLTWEGFLKKK